MSANDWQSDGLYQLILQQAEELWKHCKPGKVDWHQYVLIAEKITEHAGYCIGETVHAWIRDSNGLREISVEEHLHHITKITDHSFPFILMEFYIFPTRERVIIQNRGSTRNARGMQCKIQSDGKTIKLIPDPNTSWSS